jgi:hypothetical protein
MALFLWINGAGRRLGFRMYPVIQHWFSPGGFVNLAPFTGVSYLLQWHPWETAWRLSGYT